MHLHSPWEHVQPVPFAAHLVIRNGEQNDDLWRKGLEWKQRTGNYFDRRTQVHLEPLNSLLVDEGVVVVGMSMSFLGET